MTVLRYHDLCGDEPPDAEEARRVWTLLAQLLGIVAICDEADRLLAKVTRRGR